MNDRAQRRQTFLAVFLIGSSSLLACGEDGDPGTPAGSLQVGQGGDGQGSSSSNGNQGGDGQTDPQGGSSSKGGSSNVDPSSGSGGSSTKGGSGGSGGSSTKGGSGGSGGSSTKGGSGGSGGTGTSGSGGTGTGGAPSDFSIADFFQSPEGQETVCSDCLRNKCAPSVAQCGNLAEGGTCYDLAACIAETAKETDMTLDCAYEACGAAHISTEVNDFLTCLGQQCGSPCLATPGFTSCPK